tara:strand:+ start:226 stop:540 length:315 start_codon:yes stop_codon:yes gene_type:complete
MRSLPQNKCFHKWCEVIGEHLRANKVAITNESVKEVCLIKLGNTREFYGVTVPMRSSKYKETEAELSPAARKAGLISMSELLSMMEVWAAMDLQLNLVREEAKQ